MKHFPYIFRQRWSLIYQFFHEGNPSTQLNRTIATARKMYFRVNLEIGMRRGEMLHAMATNNWSEYFIGIGRDQNEVFKAKSKFTELDPQNASAFWGDTEKLLPAIADRSIDNFLMVLPEHSVPTTVESKSSFRSMMEVLAKKLKHDGTFRILTDIEKDSEPFRELMMIARQSGLQWTTNNKGKEYFPKEWRDPDFKPGRKPQVIVFAPK